MGSGGFFGIASRPTLSLSELGFLGLRQWRMCSLPTFSVALREVIHFLVANQLPCTIPKILSILLNPSSDKESRRRTLRFPYSNRNFTQPLAGFFFSTSKLPRLTILARYSPGFISTLSCHSLPVSCKYFPFSEAWMGRNVASEI